MKLRSGTCLGENPPQRPSIIVRAPGKFPWRLPLLQANDVLNLIHLLTICMTWEMIQEMPFGKTQNQTSTGMGSSDEAQATLTPLWTHAVAALLAVVLKWLIARSIIVHATQHHWLASVYWLCYMFMPLLTFTLTSSIWKRGLYVGFPEINSVWVVSFIAQRALEHRITEALRGRNPTGYSDNYETCFLTTECGVIFFSYVIQQMWGLCWTSSLQPVQLFCYCAGVLLRLLHLYTQGYGDKSVLDTKQPGLWEVCLRHYLHGFRLQLCGDPAVDTKAIYNSIKTLVGDTLFHVFLCIMLCMARCAHQNMPILAIVTLPGAMLLSLLLALIRMRKIKSKQMLNQDTWYHKPLQTKIGDSFLKFVLGTEFELLLLGFTQNELRDVNPNFKSDEQYEKEHRIFTEDHPVAIVYSNAKNTTGRISLLWSFSDYLCDRGLVFSLFCLSVAFCLSYTDKLPGFKPIIDTNIGVFFRWLRKVHDCPASNCSFVNTMDFFRCNLEDINRCGSTSFRNQISISLGLMFGVIGSYACFQTGKKIMLTITHFLSLCVALGVFYQLDGLTVLDMKLNLSNCESDLASCLQSKADYDGLASVLKNNRVKFDNVTNEQVRAYIKYNEGVLDALTAALEEPYLQLRKRNVEAAKKTIQHKFQQYHDPAVADQDFSDDMSISANFQLAAEKTRRNICLVTGLGGVLPGVCEGTSV